MKRTRVSIACNNLRSAFNTGSIFRIADGTGLERVYLCGYTPFPPHEKLSKTSRDTEKDVPWEYFSDISELIADKKEDGYTIISAETAEHAVHYAEVDYPEPMLLIVGNEAHGIPEKIIEKSDMTVSIPMHGVKESLNVAVAAGIILYHIISHISH